MTNRFPLWKNLLVLIVFVLAFVFALPNVFVEEPALQISRTDYQEVDEDTLTRVENTLQREEMQPTRAYVADGRAQVHFETVDDQLKAQEIVQQELGTGFVVAQTLASSTPDFLRAIGLRPMSLGLDLRGGVHFLLQVDMKTALDNNLSALRNDMQTLLRRENIRFTGVQKGEERIDVTLRDPAQLDAAIQAVTQADSTLSVEPLPSGGGFTIRLSEARLRAQQDIAIDQNINALRKRVNEIGVAEPVVQRQGLSRIVVQLPGLQDATVGKTIIGRIATLEFRLVDMENDPYEAERRGRAPLGSELFQTREGRPILLDRDIIVTGENLTDATSAPTTDGPAVNVKLDGPGGRKMLDTTRNNVGNRMAVVFIETRFVKVDGQEEQEARTEREVISDAVIRGVFSNNFQITGLHQAEANDLALLLRAGALAAPVYIVEERTIGPSLGKANIEQGKEAVVVGFVLVVLFMALYYRVFGLVANVALFMNVVLIVAVMSLLQASLTLPGIAGIVLTVGMAVDANVLIFERIREEIRNGNTPQASIVAGYEKAFSSIADANITTLIAAVVLLTFGSGPIRGFAVTLSVGILTSMFTAIVGTRAIVNLIYGGRRVERLAV